MRLYVMVPLCVFACVFVCVLAYPCHLVAACEDSYKVFDVYVVPPVVNLYVVPVQVQAVVCSHAAVLQARQGDLAGGRGPGRWSDKKGRNMGEEREALPSLQRPGPLVEGGMVAAFAPARQSSELVQAVEARKEWRRAQGSDRPSSRTQGGHRPSSAKTLPGAEFLGLQAMSSASIRMMRESGMPIRLTAL